MLTVLLLAGSVAASPGPAPEEVRAAAEKALPLIAKGAEGSSKQRDCFMCHHQALPVLALSLAKSRGFAVDDDLIPGQVEHTEADLTASLADYKKGQGQPGGVTRAGYALWTLELGGQEADETTTAV